jgi:hypothetical protein
MSYRIVTNNQKVLQTFSDELWVTRVDGTSSEVYEMVGCLLQEGWRLISAPLPPNVPLIRSPFRSLIIEESNRRYDPSGILMIEKAKEMLVLLGNVSRREALEDYAAIDLNLLQRAMEHLQPFCKGLQAIPRARRNGCGKT